MYSVYKITNNINSKIYFGYTSQTLSKRFYGHWYEPRNTIISRSIRKYGKDNFTINLIINCDNENDAKFLETFLIYRHQTNALAFPANNGMNMTDGGEGASGYKHSKELREKWSKERKGQPSPRSQFTELNDPLNKKVYHFTTDGKFVASYPSAKVAGRETNNDPSNISRCCRNELKTCGGSVFQYTATFDNRSTKRTPSKMVGAENPQSKQCFLHDVKTKTSTQYNSLGELSRLTGINYSSVKSSARTGKYICSGRLLVSYHPHLE